MKKNKAILIAMMLMLTAAGSLTLITQQVGALVETGVHNNPVPPGCAIVDFEDGTEGQIISSTIHGLQFTTTYGIDWKYADIRTDNYNVNPYGTTAYECNGNFFAWLGVSGDAGRIDFTEGDASYFSILVSTLSGVTIDAYDSSDNLIDTSGWADDNTYTTTMTRLTIQHPDMSYVIIHDTGNYWLMDDLVTDAPGIDRVLDKTLSDDALELGDITHVTINVNARDGETAWVGDEFPPELDYVDGSFMVDGVPETPLDYETIIWYQITGPGDFVIEFDLKVVDAKSWEETDVENWVYSLWYYDSSTVPVDTKFDVEPFTLLPFEQLDKSVIGSCVYNWPKFHNDLAQTGYSDSLAPDTNDLLWTYDTGSNVQSSPAIVNGILYIGDLYGNFYALDSYTGGEIWAYQTGGAIYSSPAVENGKVYFLSADGYIYALDAFTGILSWKIMIGTGGYPWASPAVHNERVFIASNGFAYSLNANDGSLIWSTAIGGQSNGPIAVANGKVYTGTHNFDNTAPTLVVLNEDTGAIIWTYDYYLHHSDVVGFINSNGVSVADGDEDGNLEVYFGVVTWTGYGPQAICLDEATGNEVWTQDINGWSTSTPAVHDGKIYIGSDDGKLYALNAGTGAYIWNYQTEAQVWAAPAVADGKVFVGSLDHKFYALDEDDGSLIWSYYTGASRLIGSPAVACGKVYVGNENGKVYAFGSASPDILKVPIKTDAQWMIKIEITNPFTYTMEDVFISDRLAGDLELHDGNSLTATTANTDPEDIDPIFMSHGDWTIWTQGNSKKVFIEWDVGDLEPGQTAHLIFLVSTDINPGTGSDKKGGKQEYTSAGWHELNSGATLKFYDEDGDQLSAYTDSIEVLAYLDMIIVDSKLYYYDDGYGTTGYNPISSNIKLKNGVIYNIIVTGTANAGSPLLFDAKWVTDNDWVTWSDTVPGYEGYGASLLQLHIDMISINWGDYNPEHIYNCYITGDGTKIDFAIRDIYPDNNVGEFTVYIY